MNNSTIVIYESWFSFLLKALISSVRSHLLYHLTGFPLFLAHCRRSSSWKYNIIIIQLLLLKISTTLEKCENNRVQLNLQLFCYALVTFFFKFPRWHAFVFNNCILFIILVIALCLTCWTSCFSIFAHNCCISIVTTSLSLSSTIFDWSCFSITKQFGHLPCNKRKQISCDCCYCETQKAMNTRHIYGMFLCSKGKANYSLSVRKLNCRQQQ